MLLFTYFLKFQERHFAIKNCVQTAALRVAGANGFDIRSRTLLRRVRRSALDGWAERTEVAEANRLAIGKALGNGILKGRKNGFHIMLRHGTFLGNRIRHVEQMNGVAMSDLSVILHLLGDRVFLAFEIYGIISYEF